MILIKQKSDSVGAIASSLCLIHCVATPFLFIAQATSATCCSTPPLWWRIMDYIFLLISFFAVYRSTQTTSSSWMKPLLWLSWSLLCFIILNEKISLLSIPEYFIYFPAITLTILHLYNKKYCQCNTTNCFTNDK
jgi:hypothetical protein